MNLYEFSQINNNEMGILIERDADGQLYRETYEEAQRLIRVSDEIKISVEKIEPSNIPSKPETPSSSEQFVSTSQLAKNQGIAPREMFEKLLKKELIRREGENWKLTEAGRKLGGSTRQSPKFGEYIVWPEGFKIE